MTIPPRIQAIELPPFDPLNRRAAELRRQGHDVISLGQAVPSFGPPAASLDAVRAALETTDVHRYVTDPGRPSLRRALAERLGATFGNALHEDEIVVTAGANHAFALAMTSLGSAGDEVILPAPYFTNHDMMVRALGMTAVEAPVADRDTWAVRWSDIEPHLTPRTRAIVLCNPSNPTGAPLDLVEGGRIVAEAAARGLLVVSDETYLHFHFEGQHWSVASCTGWRRHVVVVGSFSKSFGMMGWRLGFLLASREVCEQAVKVQDAMIICAPVVSQVAGEAAVREAWDYPLAFRDELRRRRQALADGLAGIPGVRWTPTGGGLFAFARLDGCHDSAALSTRLLEEAHVVTIPGVVFGPSGEGCLRMSYGYASRDEIAAATERVRLVLSTSGS